MNHRNTVWLDSVAKYVLITPNTIHRIAIKIVQLFLGLLIVSTIHDQTLSAFL